MQNLKVFFPALFLAFVLFGCQRDDICPESTEVTPLLIIEFYDDEERTRLKSVPNLLVHAVGHEDTLLGPATVNSIAIPLRTDQNTTDYRFVRDSGGPTENVDTITFFYDPSREYLNRACGFKVNFLGIDANTHEDEDNWIATEVILQNNVENETEEAHISLTH